jgi:Fe(3+) dicitrate transport protein
MSAVHDLTLGVRYHEDQEDRFQKEDAFRLENGVMMLTTSGAGGSQTNRVSDAEALAIFVEDRVRFGRLQITAGLRFEDYELVRDDFSKSDPTRAAGPTRTRKNSDSVFLPALSALYDVNDRLTLLAGVHRGFAIPVPGNTSSSDEKSVNYEAGGRYTNGALRIEAIAYLNDYSNLLGTVTGSTGGNGVIGDQFDGGDVDVLGLEFTAAWDAAEVVNTGNI